MMETEFGAYHPAVNFLFFAAAVILGMFFVHPAFLVASMAAAVLYYVLLTGKKGIKFLIWMVILFAAISFINPFLNIRGQTVLFTYFNGRPFTLEAILYGAATGGMFITVLVWFACYNKIMTSDKFIFLFGRCIPAVSLLLSMALRLVPNFKVRASNISGARKCIGKSSSNGSRKDRLNNGMDILSVMTSWALEDAVITADSMKSRGYGSGRRNSFSIYKLSSRDVWVICIMLICLMLVVLGMINNAAKIIYYPCIQIKTQDIYTILGISGYSAFLLIPSAIHIWEAAAWRILRSRI